MSSQSHYLATLLPMTWLLDTRTEDLVKDRRLNKGQKTEWITSRSWYSCGGETKNSSHCRKLNTSRATFSDYLLPYQHRNNPIITFKAKFLIHFFKTDPYLFSIADTMKSSQNKSMKTKQSFFPHFVKYASQGETLKMQTLII